MILLSFPVVDEISNSDPIELTLELDPGNGKCWLGVRRIVRIGRGLASYWDGRWVVRTLEADEEDPGFSDRPITAIKLVGKLVHFLHEYPGQVPIEEVLAVLDERHVGPLALAIEVLGS